MKTETKLQWCLQQQKGIRLIEPNDNLSRAYFKQSEEDFFAMQKIDKTWSVVTAYYACYHALYALLSKAGIKCEIHDCTLSLMKFFNFSEEEIKFITKLKQDRIDAQYYLKKGIVIDSKQVIAFINGCKQQALTLQFDKIEQLRGEVKNG